jgi:hypothetical protein
MYVKLLNEGEEFNPNLATLVINEWLYHEDVFYNTLNLNTLDERIDKVYQNARPLLERGEKAFNNFLCLFSNTVNTIKCQLKKGSRSKT